MRNKHKFLFRPNNIEKYCFTGQPLIRNVQMKTKNAKNTMQKNSLTLKKKSILSSK